MGSLGPTELIIILVIVIIIFGASRFADLGGAMGRGIREFRRGVRDDDQKPTDPSTPKDSSTK